MPELPNIVRERLKVSRPIATHPDADALTAFAERALPEPERAVVAEHLARCHDCRDVLALALPATVTVETARVPLPMRGGWLRAPVLRWGVVAAGLAVFAVTGLMQYQRGRGTQTFIATRQTATPLPEAMNAPASRAKESPKAALGTPRVLAEPAKAVSPSASSGDAGPAINSNGDARLKKEPVVAAPGNEAVTRSEPLALNGGTLTAALPFHGSASGRVAEGKNSGGPLKQSSRLYGGAAPSSAGVGGARSQIVAANTPDQATSQAFMDVTVDKAKAPATTVELSAEAPVVETAAASLTPPSAPIAPRWGISATGGLLRSFDQGNTWTSVDVSAGFVGGNRMAMAAPQRQRYQQSTQDTSQLQAQGQVESKTVSTDRAVIQQKAKAASAYAPIFRAVSAAGLEVWAGGSAGTLYHSADGGGRWARIVPSAAGISLTGDILSIAFSDPQHGQVTTSTQELWTTVDGGVTWQKR